MSACLPQILMAIFTISHSHRVFLLTIRRLIQSYAMNHQTVVKDPSKNQAMALLVLQKMVIWSMEPIIKMVNYGIALSMMNVMELH